MSFSLEAIRKWHRSVLNSYRDQPYSVRARMNLLLICIEMILPTTLIFLVIPLVQGALIQNFYLFAGTAALSLASLVLLTRGRRHDASGLMVFGFTCVLILSHFDIREPLILVDPLLVSRLGLYCALNLVLVVLIDERYTGLITVGLTYLVLGALQLLLIQLPNPAVTVRLLLFPYLAYFTIVSLLVLLLIQLQRIARESIKIAVDANTELEQMVTDRSKRLEAALDDLRISQQKLGDSEKLSVAGRLVAEVAHEINTPLGAIRSSNESIRFSLNYILTRMDKVLGGLDAEGFRIFLEVLQSSNTDLQRPTSSIQRSRRQDHKSYFDSVGLGRSVELSEAFTDLELPVGLSQWIPFLSREDSLEVLLLVSHIVHVQRSSAIVDAATEKADTFIQSLLRFLRGEGPAMEWVEVDIASNIEQALFLMQHELRTVHVTKQFEKTPPVKGVSIRLLQVWTNLVRNALQAMPPTGHLGLRVMASPGGIAVEIEDDGRGISEEISQQIFEPFFTTRASNEGTGLGLGIVKTIVNEHRGTLSFHSVPGKTVFTVELPFSNRAVVPTPTD